MKKFKQLVMAFLVGVVSFGFTACSDENNEVKFELPEVGSASDNELDPHIDSWPLDHDELVNALKNPTLVAGFKSSDPAKFVSENNSHFLSVLGFHGMEFVLFREGKNRTVSRRAQHHRTSRVHMDGQRSKQRDKERAQQRKLRVLIAPLQRFGCQRHNVLRSVPAFAVCNNGLQLMAGHRSPDFRRRLL